MGKIRERQKEREKESEKEIDKERILREKEQQKVEKFAERKREKVTVSVAHRVESQRCFVLVDLVKVNLGNQTSHTNFKATLKIKADLKF